LATADCDSDTGFKTLAYVPLSYVLDSLDVGAGSKTFTFSGNGVPYEFASYSASGSPEMLEKPHDEMEFRNFGGLKPFHNDYPATNAAVNFP